MHDPRHNQPQVSANRFAPLAHNTGSCSPPWPPSTMEHGCSGPRPDLPERTQPTPSTATATALQHPARDRGDRRRQPAAGPLPAAHPSVERVDAVEVQPVAEEHGVDGLPLDAVGNLAQRRVVHRVARLGVLQPARVNQLDAQARRLGHVVAHLRKHRGRRRSGHGRRQALVAVAAGFGKRWAGGQRAQRVRASGVVVVVAVC